MTEEFCVKLKTFFFFKTTMQNKEEAEKTEVEGFKAISLFEWN